GAVRVDCRVREQLLIAPGDYHLAAGCPSTALSRHERAVRAKGRGERHRHVWVTGWRWWWPRRWCRRGCSGRGRWWRRACDIEERRLQSRDTSWAGLGEEHLVIAWRRIGRHGK